MTPTQSDLEALARATGWSVGRSGHLLVPFRSTPAVIAASPWSSDGDAVAALRAWIKAKPFRDVRIEIDAEETSVDLFESEKPAVCTAADTLPEAVCAALIAAVSQDAAP